MGRQELNEKIAFEQAAGIRGGFVKGLIGAIKFIAALLIFPLLFGVSRALHQQLSAESDLVYNSFLLGIVVYVVIHLFIFTPHKLHDGGQLFAGRLFSFFVPLRSIMYVCLPAYASVFFGLYFLAKAFFGYQAVIGSFVFLISFSITLHIVLGAVNLKNEARDPLRGDYFFSLFFMYLFNIVLLAAFFHCMLKEFSFVAVLEEGVRFSIETLTAVWRQLFVV